MIFIILGSQKFQFNRLLKAVDDLVEHEIIKDDVFAQSGYSEYKPLHYSFKHFLDKDAFDAMEDKSEIIISHGGTGSIISAIKKGKKVIAIPRYAKYGEHVDDHQIQLIEQFDEMKLIEPCWDVSMLETAYKNVKRKKYVTYSSNTSKIIKNIETYIDTYANTLKGKMI